MPVRETAARDSQMSNFILCADGRTRAPKKIILPAFSGGNMSARTSIRAREIASASAPS
jgi:hypothetical protein